MSSNESSSTQSEPGGDVDRKAGTTDSAAESSTSGVDDGCSSPEDWSVGRVLQRCRFRDRSAAPFPRLDRGNRHHMPTQEAPRRHAIPCMQDAA